MDGARHGLQVVLWHVCTAPVRFVRWLRAAIPRVSGWAVDRLMLAYWRRRLRRTAARSVRKSGAERRLYWGPEPIVSFKYWSDMLREVGYESTAVATHRYEIFSDIAFDREYADILEASRLPAFVVKRSAGFIAFEHLLRNFDVAHIPMTGGPLSNTALADEEPKLLQRAGIRSVILPYGADVLRYSWISDPIRRHGLLISYPWGGRHEAEVDRWVMRWVEHADVIVGGLELEGLPRWDVLATNYISMPEGRIKPRDGRSRADGSGEPVRIVHAPNHRGVKGTEFIVAAVEALRARGLAVELVLLEKAPNQRVLEEMAKADICIDQCTQSAYGLFAIEAMASGSAVVGNLEDDRLLEVHRRFAWLDQCPIVSTDIDRLEATIEALVRDPDLREQLGSMGSEYVDRFHSAETSRHLFESIYRSLDGEDVDLMQLFHPLTSEYMQRFEPLRPPLRRNRLETA